MRAIAKLAVAALLALGLEGCASQVMDYSHTPMPRERGQTHVEEDTHKPMQCAPYAREHSGIRIYGDAYTWWDKAAGKYPRGPRPEAGAIMVLHDYAGDTSGHLAVVRRLISSREIRIDHANWLNDGSIYVNNPVEDVSSGNDWSVVRVYNLKTGGWGTKLYPVQGFIGSGSSGASDDGPTADNGGSRTSALVGEIN
jgi:surface antigen